MGKERSFSSDECKHNCCTFIQEITNMVCKHFRAQLESSVILLVENELYTDIWES